MDVRLFASSFAERIVFATPLKRLVLALAETVWLRLGHSTSLLPAKPKPRVSIHALPAEPRFFTAHPVCANTVLGDRKGGRLALAQLLSASVSCFRETLQSNKSNCLTAVMLLHHSVLNFYILHTSRTIV